MPLGNKQNPNGNAQRPFYPPIMIDEASYQQNFAFLVRECAQGKRDGLRVFGDDPGGNGEHHHERHYEAYTAIKPLFCCMLIVFVI